MSLLCLPFTTYFGDLSSRTRGLNHRTIILQVNHNSYDAVPWQSLSSILRDQISVSFYPDSQHKGILCNYKITCITQYYEQIDLIHTNSFTQKEKQLLQDEQLRTASSIFGHLSKSVFSGYMWRGTKTISDPENSTTLWPHPQFWNSWIRHWNKGSSIEWDSLCGTIRTPPYC